MFIALTLNRSTVGKVAAIPTLLTRQVGYHLPRATGVLTTWRLLKSTYSSVSIHWFYTLIVGISNLVNSRARSLKDAKGCVYDFLVCLDNIALIIEIWKNHVWFFCNLIMKIPKIGVLNVAKIFLHSSWIQKKSLSWSHSREFSQVQSSIQWF